MEEDRRGFPAVSSTSRRRSCLCCFTRIIYHWSVFVDAHQKRFHLFSVPDSRAPHSRYSIQWLAPLTRTLNCTPNVIVRQCSRHSLPGHLLPAIGVIKPLCCFVFGAPDRFHILLRGFPATAREGQITYRDPQRVIIFHLFSAAATAAGDIGKTVITCFSSGAIDDHLFPAHLAGSSQRSLFVTFTGCAPLTSYIGPLKIICLPSSVLQYAAVVRTVFHPTAAGPEFPYSERPAWPTTDG